MARTSPTLAPRMDAVDGTMIRTMYDLAERQSSDLVRLEIGEPDFDTPAHIIDAAARAARDGATHYTSNAGIPALREAIAKKQRRDHELAVDPNRVVATAGATEALFLTLLTTSEAGDEVVIPTPAWPQYRLQVQLVGATPVEVALSPANDFDLDVDRVVDAITDDTACVVLNSPSNPTSRVYDVAAVEAVVDAAADHDAVVVLDEVYTTLDYAGDGRSLAADLDADNVVVINACSKQYAMTGWRLGWLVGPQHLVEAAITLHPGTSACPSSLSQHGAVAALSGPQDEAEAMAEAFRERRDYVQRRVDQIPQLSCPPAEGGFYAFLDVRALDGSSFDVATRLLESYGVVTVPGEGFGAGGEGFVRASFASGMDELAEGFDRIERMFRDELA